MRPHKLVLSFLATFASQAGLADTLQWDPSQIPGTPSGGTGNWNLADAFWSDGALNVIWTDTSGRFDTATFGATAGTVTLGTDLGAEGLVFGTPGYTLTGATLTLGAKGIDASTLVSGTTSIGSNLTIRHGQTWNVGAGSILDLNTGTFTRSPGATLNLSGTGTVTSAMAGLANVNSIVGPWASIGTGTNARFATLNVGSLVAYTGGTASNLTGAWGGSIPANGNGTLNYDMGASGTLGLTGLLRNVNTLRYTGTGATQQANFGGAGGADIFTANGIMNAGTGTLTIGGGANGLNVGIGTNRDLVVATMSANVSLLNIIKDNAGGASSLTKTGPNTLTLSGPSSFTGDIHINGGTLTATLSRNVNNPTTSALGNPQVARNFNVNDGGTLQITGADFLGSATTTPVATLIVNEGGTVTNNGNNFNSLGPVILNGGTIRTAGGAIGGYQSYNLMGSVTVGGDAPSSIQVTGPGNAFNGVHLNTDTLFTVADATGDSASDLSVSAPLIDRNASLLGAGGFTKAGPGTMALGAVNTFTGPTKVNEGNLALNAGSTLGTTSSLAVNGGTVTLGAFNPLGTGVIPPVTLASGGTLTMSGPFSVNLNVINLNGGELSNAGLFDPVFGSYYLRGPVNAESITSTISATEITAPGDTTFTVLTGGTLDVTGSFSNLFGAFGLVKSGGGTMNLSNANTYSGNTTINEGTLALTGSGSIANSPAISVASGATFDVSAASFTLGAGRSLGGSGSVAGSMTDSPGSQYLPGGSGTTGTLTFNNNLTLSGGSSVIVDIDDLNHDKIVVNGDLTPNGVTAITLGTQPASGLFIGSSYVLFDVAGTLGGTPANFSAPGLDNRKTLSISQVGSDIVMNVGGNPPAAIVWQGGGTDPDAWDLQTSQNWLLGGSPDQYFSEDLVSFTDAGLGQPVVDLPGPVSPGSVLVDSTGNYTFSGTGGITGAGSLTKTNTGSLTLATVNDYSGGTFIENGEIVLGTPDALPVSGLLTLGSGSDSGALRLDGWNQTLAGIALSGTGTDNRVVNGNAIPSVLTITGSGLLDATLGGPAADDDNFSLVTADAAVVTLTSANTFSGGTTAAGTSVVDISSPAAIGTGPLTLSGGSFDNTSGGPVTLAHGNDISNTFGRDIVFGGGNDLTTTGTLTYDSVFRSAIVNNAGKLTVGALAGAAPAVFIKNGTGTLEVTGPAGTNVNGIEVLNGLLVLSGANNTYGGFSTIGVNGAGTRIGTLRAAADGALGSSTIDIGPGGNDATAVLEFAGDFTHSNPVLLPGRNNPAPAVRNVSGDNTLTGPFTLTVGGTAYTIVSDADSLTLGSAGNPLFAALPASGSRNFNLGGAGNGVIAGDVSFINGPLVMNLNKSGAGTWTIGGNLAFTGNTTVTEGTLAVASDDVFDDASTVTLASVSSLNLTHSGTDTVTALVIDNIPQPAGTYTFGTGKLKVGLSTPFEDWATDQGLTGAPGFENGPDDDPDGDGTTNALEFAFNGDPLDPSNNGMVFQFTADSSDAGTDDELILTIAVRGGTPAFTGSPSPGAAHDGIEYSVQGSTELVDFTGAVSPVDPVVTGLPDLTASGYEYRSFSLDSSDGLQGRGFLRAVAEIP